MWLYCSINLGYLYQFYGKFHWWFFRTNTALDIKINTESVQQQKTNQVKQKSKKSKNT
jgi:hypothetical protein